MFKFFKSLYKKIIFIHPGLRMVNFIFQRIFRINSTCKYSVHYTSQIRNQDSLVLGKNVTQLFAKMSHCNVQASNGVSIGDNTIFASGATLISANHDEKDLWYGGNVASSPIIIGKDCWLGANVVVLPGVKLGNGVIVGANSVVTKSFNNDEVIAGNPAKFIRNRKNSNQL